MENEHRFKDTDNFVQVRVISSQKIPLDPEVHFDKKGLFQINKTVKKYHQTEVPIETLLIHIHGGGFIATSSASH